MMHGQTQIKN